MANIVDKIRQIRQAVYGKDVRESIASSLEEMNKDNIKAIQDANTAIASANEAKENANTSASNAIAAASNANDAAQAATDLVSDITAKLEAGEFDGPQGPQGEKGDKGDKGDNGNALPAGVMHEYAGSSAPAGYFLCQGQAVSRTTYADLFQVIGTTYGSGDGSTTFNVPDMRGRVAVGLHGGDTDFNELGKHGGSKTHILSVDEMPSHTHTQNAHKHSASGSSGEAGAHGHSASSNSTGAHTHTVSGTAASAGNHKHTGLYYRDGLPISFTVYGGDTTGYMTDYKNQNSVNASYITTGNAGAHTHTISGTAASAGGHSHTITVTSNGAHSHTVSVTVSEATATNQNTGGGQAHNNMQPYTVINYIIKY